MRNSDRLLILSVVVLLVYLVLSILFPNLTSPFGVIYNWLLYVSTLLGYLGAFFVSVIGNATILVPFPYIGVAFILGGLRDEITMAFVFDPWLIGIISGIGAMIGEMTGYFIGYGGGKLIDKDQTSAFKEFVDSHPRATPFVIWFLAATPIPDDVLVVPLGAARYSWWKVALAQLIGKTMFLMGISWSGRIGLDFVGSILGNTNPLSLLSRVIEVSSVLLVILSIYLLVRIDWNALVSGKKIES
ncbi:MAG: VTT domain-containing protein [Candidatus Thorarchaeota archaeon]|jgi:membrane protein YqaA with SNARE-associated domain